MNKRTKLLSRTQSYASGTFAKLCLLCAFFLSALSIQAQENQRISIDFKGETLESTIWYIQNRTNYVFVYTQKDVAGVKDITLRGKNKTVSEILDECLEGTNLTYEIIDKKIVIKKKQSQQVTISGWVHDAEGEALPGATVTARGSKDGAIAGMDGRYTLTIPAQKGLILTYSFIGMEKKTVRYAGKNNINVTLKSGVGTEMEEVVVTGYQNIKRRDLVGSITTVKAKDVIMPSFTTIDQMLQGRVAGMVVTNTSSRVGTAPKIQIRGTSTLLGNQDPLWVIDGIIQEDPLTLETSNSMTGDLKDIIGNQISWLNPSDIENITILKDASATAIYGSKASNGVIEITTKKNTTDRLSVNYTANFVIGSRPNYEQFNYMNSKERVQFSQEAFNWGTSFAKEPIKQPYTYEGLLRMYLEHDISAEEFIAQRGQLETQNTDWFKLLTRRSFSHNHNLSISGGTNKFSYSTSVGYSKSDGQEIGNSSERMTGRIALTMRPVQKLTINAALNGSVSTNKGFAGGVAPMDYATTTNRIINPDVFYQKTATYDYNDNVQSLGYNFINERNNSSASSSSTHLSASLDLKWDILDWLSYQFTGGYSNTSSNSESYMTEQTYYIAQKYRGYDYNSVTPGSAEFKAAVLPFGGELYNNDGRQSSYNIQNKILISKAFDQNNRLNALIGMELRSSTNKSLGHTMWGYAPDRGEVILRPTTLSDFQPITGSGQSGWGILEELYSGHWSKTNVTDNYLSFFATFAYSFMNRYVVNANVRNDASNRFGQDTNHRFDPTYSFGFSWRASEEEFIKKHLKWITDLNIRATYGIQGNALTRLSPDLILTQGTVKEVYNRYYSTISQIPNPNLSWERTKTWNFGIDLSLFNKFFMNVEYYTRSSNAIISQDLPFEYGMLSMRRNGGIIHNRGLEYTLSFSPIQKKDYALNVSLNASKNWNKGGQSNTEVNASAYLSGRSDIILKEGYPLSGFWSYSFAGLNGTNGEPTFNNLDVPEEQRNKKIDPTTYLVYSGQRDPYFTGGLSLSFRYKSVTLNSSLSLLLGGKKRLTSPFSEFASSYYMPDPYSNVNRDLLDRWKQPGDEAYTNIPALPRAGATIIGLPNKDTSYPIPLWEMSDALVVSSSFLRCRNIGLSWQMPRELCKKMFVHSFALNFNMDNIFVIASKRFNGFDPELSNSVYPHSYSIGFNIGF